MGVPLVAVRCLLLPLLWRERRSIFAGQLKNNSIMKKLFLFMEALLLTMSSCHGHASREAASVTKGLTGGLTGGQTGNLTSSLTGSLSSWPRGCQTVDDSTNVFLKVSRVIDGDTFEGRIDDGGNPGVNPWARELTKIVIRVNGIDAPERGQYYGDVATLHLQWLINGKVVGLKLKQKDIYGRWIATVYLDGKDIADEMLSRGLAWHYKEHDSNPHYAQLETEARWNGLGIWCDDRPVAPWIWRTMTKDQRDAYR